MLSLLCVALAPFSAACGGGDQVLRRRGNVEQFGRSIPAVAYAWYVRGLHHERAGDLSRAARDFAQATRHDPRSGSAWAAWGRTMCTQKAELARELFDQGIVRAERKAPVHVARANCALTLHETSGTPGKQEKVHQAALNDAKRAVRLEPENRAANVLLVRCHQLAGNHREATRVARAYELFTGIPTESSAPATPTRRQLLSAVDRAIWREDLHEAADLALTVISPGELAARAALWGRIELAWTQTQFVLAANPSDIDAQVTRLVLNTETPSEGAPRGSILTSALAPWLDVSEELSPVSIALLAQHLRRTAGDHAAEHFLLQHRSTLRNSEDPLIDGLRAREAIAEPNSGERVLF